MRLPTTARPSGLARPWPPYYRRGLVYVGKGEHDKAIADYSEAIRLSPKFALAYNKRASPMLTKAISTMPLPTTPKPFASTRKIRRL